MSNSASAQVTCPFCLRPLPADFAPLPLVLPCCGRLGCASCVKPLLQSAGWTCLSCFKVSARAVNQFHRGYLGEIERRADPEGKHNCTNAQIYLGMVCLNSKRDEQAINWFLKAERSILTRGKGGGGGGGSICLPPPCQFKLGLAHESGSLRSQTVDSKRLAMQWFQRAGEKKYIPACLRLGAAFEFGEFSVRRSLNSASGWYGKAAEQGDAEGAFKLGTVFLKMEPPKNVSAVRWFKVAVEKEHVQAMVALGKLYRLGLGMDRIDHREAVILFTMAADWESAEGQYWLGRCYEFGDGVPKASVEQAVHYYKRSSMGKYEKADKELVRLGAVSRDGAAMVYVERPNSCARCGKHESDFDRVMLMCRRCHAVGYCGVECKQLHFRSTHRRECGKMTPLDHGTGSLPKGTEEVAANYDSGGQGREPGVVYHSPSRRNGGRDPQSGEWEVFTDESSGASYWYNHYTGESQWDDPNETPMYTTVQQAKSNM
jgi:TPR repeat protein